MKDIDCKHCIHWTMTDPRFLIGWCALFQKLTEWCAGIILQSPKKLIICPGFTPRP